jgi:hypothetical protein
MAETLRDKLERRLAGMKAVRQDYEEECKEVARFAQPSRSRFLATDKDKGARRRTWNKRLLDPHGIEAFRTLTNGMTSGLSSASRPWFSLTLKDEEIAAEDEVRDWLSEVERRMYAFLAQTNFYGATKSGYAELGLFGTEACVAVEHRSAGLVFHPLTFGEYWIAVGTAMVPDTLYRECTMTARQMVDSFGNKASKAARQAYDRSDHNQIFTCFHAIEPNDEHDDARFGSKPWRSAYWDQASDKTHDDAFLRLSGFEEQPFWAARWDVVGSDTYGVSPGFEALPSLRELQMQNKRRNEAIDQMVKPEKIVPPGVRLTGQPGNTVSSSGVDKDQIIIPYQMPYQAVAAIGEEIEKCRRQIDGLSFADLFNAITNMRGIQPRNVEEIASRNEEKLTQLGPVIENIGKEKLSVAIDRVFGVMMRGNMLPPPPDVLRGVDIDVEFISILHQMQRMVGIGQIERTAAFVGNLAAASPDALDKLDTDQMIDEYASRAGAPAKMIRGDDKVQEIRAQRAAQQKAAQMAATMPAVQQGADAARLLSETDVGGESLLDRMLPA